MGKKLNDEEIADVIAMREAGVSLRDIAKLFGVSRSLIWELVDEKGRETALKRVSEVNDPEEAERRLARQREASRRYRLKNSLLN